MKQTTLAAAADQGAEFERFREPTRRDVFLQTVESIVPWAALCEVIEPHYPKAGKGRPPIGLERMLRMYFVQHWFNLADEACEEALLNSTALRRFVGIDLGRERVPDGTTLLKFRRLLEDDKHKLGAALFAKVGEVLQSKGMKVGTGTIVDATIISAPSSTKNDKGERDSEMHQTRKGKQWHFGMKLHIGVDSETGLAHSAVVTSANVHDKHPLSQLLHGGEQEVFGDCAFSSQHKLIAAKAPNARDRTNQRVSGTGVWVQAESRRVGKLQLPNVLYERMLQSPQIQITAPMAVRFAQWQANEPELSIDPGRFMRLLAPLQSDVGDEEFAEWQDLAGHGKAEELFGRVMSQHFDRLYEQTMRRTYVQHQRARHLHLESLQPSSLTVQAERLAAEYSEV